jgi:transposase
LDNDETKNIILNNEQLFKYNAVVRYINIHQDISRLATQLSCSDETALRYVDGYKAGGKAFFARKETGKVSNRVMSTETKEKIIYLYQHKYAGWTYEHFNEFLKKHENIHYSKTSVRDLLIKNCLLSPSVRKYTSAMVKKLQAERTKKNETKENARSNIEENMELRSLLDHDPHPFRPRKRYSGELIQVDAATHCWFGDTKTYLHIAVDDATSKLLAGFFDTQETLYAYFNVLKDVLLNHGIPSTILSDNRNVFTNNLYEDVRDRITQFGYACENLGIRLKATSIPQTKGRVERALKTLQHRLPLELRIAGVSTIAGANAFLGQYIIEYNSKFGKEAIEPNDVFADPPSADEINLLLSTHYERPVGVNGVIRFESTDYVVLNSNGNLVNLRKGLKGNVTKTLDGSLYFNIANDTYALKARTLTKPDSKECRAEIDVIPHLEITIPKNMHIWKTTTFERFVNKQTLE